MLNRTGWMCKISIEYKILLIGNFSGISQTKCCCIKIEISACIKCIDIPSYTNNHIFESRIFFCKAYFLALF